MADDLREKLMDSPARDLGVDIPEWIEQDITPHQVEDIIQGGCSSGAYMPAVTYYQASRTMAECGDEVLTYIEGQLGELPGLPESPSWSGIACHYLSIAVELWAGMVQGEIEGAISEEEEEAEEE